MFQTYDELIELASAGDLTRVCTVLPPEVPGGTGLHNTLPAGVSRFCFGQAAGKQIGLFYIFNYLCRIMFYICIMIHSNE